MVCKKCEKKLVKVSPPDPWKEASAANPGSAAAADPKDKNKKSGPKLGANKLLVKPRLLRPMGKGAAVMAPGMIARKCKECKKPLHQDLHVWCQTCAYKQGICAMCGTKIIEVKFYKQSIV